MRLAFLSSSTIGASHADPVSDEPGIVDGMAHDDYLNIDALSSSGCKVLERSPAHFLASRTYRKPPTAQMEIGTAVHTIVLEPERASSIVCLPDFNTRTKDGRAERDAWVAALPAGSLAFDQDAHARIHAAAYAVRQHPGASRLLADGKRERSMFWRDSKLRIPCKSRLDWHREDGGIVDVKTTADASPAAFERSIANFGYHIQAAFYWVGVEHVLDRSPAFWSFVCVEVEPPFAVACYVLDVDAIRVGMRTVDKCLARYAQCVASGQWPGYPDTINPISIPKWAKIFPA